MKIDFIIPNYNGEALLEKNLPNIVHEAEEYNANIVIVDDGSTDSSLDIIRKYQKRSKRLYVVTHSVNQGFSSAVNSGVQKSQADIVVLLNSDVVPNSGFLIPVIEDFKKNGTLFGVGCLDKSIEQGKTVLRGRGIAYWQRGLLVHKKGEANRRDTFWVSGGSSAIRRIFFNQLGGFDTIYDPFYWEDIDLSFRARKAGFQLLFEAKSIVIHRHEEGAIKVNYSTDKITSVAYRNQFIFIWKNITDIQLLVSHLIWLPYHIFLALLRIDVPFFIGLFLALSRLPVIVQKRQSQKKYYVIRDKQILSRDL